MWLLVDSADGCARHLTEKYAKVTIFGNEEKLAELNSLGLPLDHVTIYRDSAITGYFSYYDLKKVKKEGVPGCGN